MKARLKFSLREAQWAQDATAISELRRKVFIEEQGVPEDLEIDGLDSSCVLVVAESPDGKVVGTGRMQWNGHIGRLAVAQSYRGQGVGAALVLALVDIAKRELYIGVDLNAQEHAVGFYEKLGFQPEGDIFFEAGIPHRHMKMLF